MKDRQLDDTVMGYECARQRTVEYDHYRDQISPQFRDLITNGRMITDAQYHGALATRDRASAILERLFDDADAILVPSAPGPAPAGLRATGDPLFSRLWNLLQNPCIALPFGMDASGLPLGLQLIGRRGQDAKLLDTASWVFALFR